MNTHFNRHLLTLATAAALAIVPLAANAARYADVVRVTRASDDRNCHYEDVRTVERERGNDRTGKVVGAIVGGVIGNQVGSGNGRTLATVGGAVAGAAIGGKVDRDNNPRREVVRSERVCNGGNAFNVDYRWNGDVRSTRLAYDPGRSVKVDSRGRVIR